MRAAIAASAPLWLRAFVHPCALSSLIGFRPLSLTPFAFQERHQLYLHQHNIPE